MSIHQRIIIFAGLAGLLSMPALAGNIVQNGDFEAGSFAWNATVGTNFNNFPPAAHAGAGFVDFICNVQNGTFCQLDQGLMTSSGSAYTVSFWYNSDATGTRATPGLLVSWGGATLQNITSHTVGYQQFVYNVTGGAGSTLLRFQGEAQASGLDDVCVSSDNSCASAATPEPSSAMLIWSGIALFGLTGRRLVRRSL